MSGTTKEALKDIDEAVDMLAEYAVDDGIPVRDASEVAAVVENARGAVSAVREALTSAEAL